MFVDGRSRGLTYANIHIVQLCRGIAVVSKLAQLAVLPPSVVLTAHANDGVQHLDVTAAVGVTEAFAVLQKGERDGAVFRVSVRVVSVPSHARFGWPETAEGWQTLLWMQPAVLDVRSRRDERRSGVVIRKFASSTPKRWRK